MPVKRSLLKGCLFMLLMAVVCLSALFAVSRFGPLMDAGIMGGSDKIAVIEVEGLITQSRPFIEKLSSYGENDRIKAVVLRIDSPGGGVGPSQEMYEEVVKLRGKKTIVASMGSVAASGGYYLACGAHKIVANPGTITGSIGVIIEFANVEELLGKIGLKSVVIKSGTYKDVLSPVRQMQDDERRLIQGVIDDIHGQFINAVAAGRELPRQQVAALADGRIFSGEQAQKLGLVDALGNLQDALKIAAELAGIAGKPEVVYPEKKRPSLWEFIIDGSLSHARELFAARGLTADFLLKNAPGT